MLSLALENCDLFQKPTETLGYPDTQASCALPQPEVVNGTDPPPPRIRVEIGLDIKLIPNLKNRKRLNKSQILVYFQWLEIVTVLFCYFSGYWQVYVILGGNCL